MTTCMATHSGPAGEALKQTLLELFGIMSLLSFSCSVMSEPLQPHGLQHTRYSCPSPSPRACSNSRPLSQWCHPTISSSVVPSSSCFLRFPALRSFPMSRSSHQVDKSITASASVLSMNIQGWFPLWLTDLISLQSKGLSSLPQHHSSKSLCLQCSAFFMVQLSHPYVTTGKTKALTTQAFAGKVMSLLFKTLSRFVIAFLPRSKHLVISWLQSLSTVILEPKKNEVCHCFHCFPIYLPWSDGIGCCDVNFLNVEF